MTILDDCEHYDPAGPDHVAVVVHGCPLGTCLSCGGRPQLGPSCNCPVFGENDDEDDA